MTTAEDVKVVYIAGPMTGMPDFNFPAFYRQQEALQAAGYVVLNPAANADGDTSLPRSFYMRRDIEMLLGADAVWFLPGWKQSRGAQVEHLIAEELELTIAGAPE